MARTERCQRLSHLPPQEWSYTRIFALMCANYTQNLVSALFRLRFPPDREVIHIH